LSRGATKGIGRAIALDLAARGACVLGTYTSSESAHLFDTLAHSISSLYTSRDSTDTTDLDQPKLIGIAADIVDPFAPLVIIEALRRDFGAKVDIVVFNAAVMTLARMGDGKIDQSFVSDALIGNIQFPVILMEGLVRGKVLRPNSRVVAISSEGVRARRPGGG
jgi:3-oxoacyl-[acyl-carrier protein] reductase